MVTSFAVLTATSVQTFIKVKWNAGSQEIPAEARCPYCKGKEVSASTKILLKAVPVSGDDRMVRKVVR